VPIKSLFYRINQCQARTHHIPSISRRDKSFETRLAIPLLKSYIQSCTGAPDMAHMERLAKARVELFQTPTLSVYPCIHTTLNCVNQNPRLLQSLGCCMPFAQMTLVIKNASPRGDFCISDIVNRVYRCNFNQSRANGRRPEDA
jgi:hypothetical protein